jgi:murein L,D-transpeptidase YafK
VLRPLVEWDASLKWTACYLVSALLLASVAVSVVGCSTVSYQARTGVVHAATLQQMESFNMDRQAPILIRIYKEERALEVWKQDRTGRFALLASYPICKFSGKLGPKVAQGDYQAPEGFYDIAPAQLNPQSSEYLAFNIGFPNAFDRSLGRTGNFLMVHGGCRSVGCYAMTDYQMEEIYGLVEDAFRGGQDRVPLQAFPFQMTADNVMRHADDSNAPFWQMLKEGSDAFTVAGLPPKVAVCNQRYVFNAPSDQYAPCATVIDPLASHPRS